MPASLLMAKIGRKGGFLLGGATGVAGGLVAAAAIVLGSFWLFVLGSALCGSYHGWNQLYRFAAADTATPAYKARAISLVMVGGLISAFVGPQLVIYAQVLIPAAALAGPYVAASIVVALAMIPVILTRFPAFSEQPGAAEPPRPLSVVARQPIFIVSVITGMVAYALMNLVMTASPIAMIACGHSISDAALGIQWHVIGMFAPSFFTAKLIARYGRDTISHLGLAMLALCGVVAIAGISVAHFWAALILLGAGWNFAFVGATTMVTQAHRPSERGKVQGLFDSLVLGMVAVASLAAGWLQNTQGWTAVNLLIFPSVIFGALALIWLARTNARTPAVA
jgi:MFS family permease